MANAPSERKTRTAKPPVVTTSSSPNPGTGSAMKPGGSVVVGRGGPTSTAAAHRDNGADERKPPGGKADRGRPVVGGGTNAPANARKNNPVRQPGGSNSQGHVAPGSRPRPIGFGRS